MKSATMIVKISSLFACLVLINAYPNGPESSGYSSLKIIPLEDHSNPIRVGTSVGWRCSLSIEGDVWWMKDKKNVTSPDGWGVGHILKLKAAKIEDSGSYTCVAKTKEEGIIRETINVTIIESVKQITENEVHTKFGRPASLLCQFESNDYSSFEWYKKKGSENNERLTEGTSVQKIDDNHFQMTLNFTKVTDQENGTYECRAKVGNNIVKIKIPLIVFRGPGVRINIAKAIATDSIYLNWTLFDVNDLVRTYTVQYKKNSTLNDSYFDNEFLGGKFSHVLNNLEKNTSYIIQIKATDFLGEQNTYIYPESIRTLEKDPEFVPEPTLLTRTDKSITINWKLPSNDLRNYFHYYNITINDHGKKSTPFSSDKNEKTFDNLQPGTSYGFRVTACSDDNKKCGRWSDERQFQTLGKNVASNSLGLQSSWINLVLVAIVSLFYSVRC